MFFVSLFYSLYNDLSVDKSRPELLCFIVGLTTALVNVYSIQGGHWSVIAVVTAASTVCITLVAMTMYIQYMVWTKPAWKENRAMNKPRVT